MNLDLLNFKHFSGLKYTKNWNSKPLKCKNWQIFNSLESQKLISRKIWAIEKSWNFHTVWTMAKCSEKIKWQKRAKTVKNFKKNGQNLPVWSSSSETQKYSPNQHGDSTSSDKTWKIKKFHVSLAGKFKYLKNIAGNFKLPPIVMTITFKLPNHHICLAKSEKLKKEISRKLDGKIQIL